MARHYDAITPAWTIILGEDFHHGLFDGADRDLWRATRSLTRELDAAADPPTGARIVDLGCGTGTQACWLAVRHDAAEVVGVTTSEVGAAAGRQRSAAAGLDDVVTFLTADALDSRLPAASFDVVWSIESSQYIVPRSSLMAECFRLLVPGGRLALCDVMLARPLELRELRRLHADLDILRDVFGEAVMGTPDEYRAAVGAAGLALTRDEDLSERVLPTFGCWRERARGASAAIVDLVGEPWLTRFIAGCDVMERLFLQGIVRYGLIVAERPQVGQATGIEVGWPR